MTPKPESETGPWTGVKATYADIAVNKTARVYLADVVDAARAAEATQHQQEIAELEQRHADELAAVRSSQQLIDQIATLRAERDRLKAAAQAVLDNGTCADPDCCKAAIKHEAALVELRAALSGEGTAK